MHLIFPINAIRVSSYEAFFSIWAFKLCKLHLNIDAVYLLILLLKYLTVKLGACGS